MLSKFLVLIGSVHLSRFAESYQLAMKALHHVSLFVQEIQLEFVCCPAHVLSFIAYIFQPLTYVVSKPFLPTQVDHTIVRISAKIILYIMLVHLGIRKAVYRRRIYTQNTISVIMLFYTSVQSNGYVFCIVRLPSNALLSLQSLYVQMT
uniref:Uncharacterized protein n=1 Tax=Triticum urartu TaxID=4572 RepID=A0A8R7U9I4_TRIUA